MKTLFPTTATDRALHKDALVAGPASPKPGGTQLHPPARTVAAPVSAATTHTALPLATNRLPPLSSAKPYPNNDAIVVMIRVPAATRRMQLLEESAIKMLPPPSTATPFGCCKEALVAGPSSPLGPGPPPATVVMIPEFMSTCRTRLL